VPGQIPGLRTASQSPPSGVTRPVVPNGTVCDRASKCKTGIFYLDQICVPPPQATNMLPPSSWVMIW
ncbi:MAG: hypothetical protein LAT67_08905, partial [Balneolales bacterium]|nr:hypothetical protein [Balneolales bacterium]